MWTDPRAVRRVSGRWGWLGLVAVACAKADGGSTDVAREDSAVSDTPTETAAVAWRSALYPEAWSPGFGVGDAVLPDVSYAGWHHGESEPPEVSGPVFPVGPPSGGDDTAAVQAAIEAAAAGGVVLFSAGTYRLDGLLRQPYSGVVLRGMGQGSTTLWWTRATGMSDTSHLTVGAEPVLGSLHALEVDAARGDSSVRLGDVGGLSVGDDVVIGWTITPAFVADHGMTDVWTVFLGQWASVFRRRIEAIDATTGTVTLDVPLRYATRTRDGAALAPLTGLVREVGVEDLSVATAAGWADAWSNDRSHALSLQGVVDGWVRRVSSVPSPGDPSERADHLASGGVLVLRSSRVLIDRVTMSESQNRGGGGNGYLFEVQQVSEVLLRDCVARAGRHNFIQNWGFGTSGVVWLRPVSEQGKALWSEDSETLGTTGFSEYHHSLAMDNLVDGAWVTDGWKAVDRGLESSGAGVTATGSVFWNTRGTGYLQSFQAGLGYVIGTDGVQVQTEVTDLPDRRGTSPDDWTEGVGAAASLAPASLYEDQRARRLARGERLWAP
ncbi:MAG: hypothetical protein RLZZ383_2394 [Pseudomonadota bacterium]